MSITVNLQSTLDSLPLGVVVVLSFVIMVAAIEIIIFSQNQPEEIRLLINQRIRQMTESGQLYDLVKEYDLPAQPPDY